MGCIPIIGSKGGTSQKNQKQLNKKQNIELEKVGSRQQMKVKDQFAHLNLNLQANDNKQKEKNLVNPQDPANSRVPLIIEIQNREKQFGLIEMIEQIRVIEKIVIQQINKRIEQLYPQAMSSLFLQLCRLKIAKYRQSLKSLNEKIQKNDNQKIQLLDLAKQFKRSAYEVMWIADCLKISRENWRILKHKLDFLVFQ